MITKEIIVKTSGGIHVGIATSIKSIIKNKEDSVFIKHSSEVVNCRNILKVVALNIMQGKKIVLMVDGTNEEEVLQEIEKIIT